MGGCNTADDSLGGGTQPFTAAEFESFGCAMVIRPIGSLPVAAKAQGDLYEAIGYVEYEALDGQIARSAPPAAGNDEPTEIG